MGDLDLPFTGKITETDRRDFWGILTRQLKSTEITGTYEEDYCNLRSRLLENADKIIETYKRLTEQTV